MKTIDVIIARLLASLFNDIKEEGFKGLTKAEQKIVGSKENFKAILDWIKEKKNV